MDKGVGHSKMSQRQNTIQGANSPGMRDMGRGNTSFARTGTKGIGAFKPRRGLNDKPATATAVKPIGSG